MNESRRKEVISSDKDALFSFQFHLINLHCPSIDVCGDNQSKTDTKKRARADKINGADKTDRLNRADKANGADGADRVDRKDKADKANRAGNSSKADKAYGAG